MTKQRGGSWNELRARIMKLLQNEAELEEIVKLVGMDALSASDRLTLETARSIREDYLHQDAFHEVDTYTSVEKQYLMMKLILNYYDMSFEALQNGINIEELVKLSVRERIGRFKYIPQAEAALEYEKISAELKNEISTVGGGRES